MGKLDQAIKRAKAGDKAGARQLLTEIVQAEPNNETAWLWMSGVVEKKEQQIYCLQQALRINPGNTNASAKLTALTSENKPLENLDNRISNEGGHPGAPSPANSVDQGLPLPNLSNWSKGFRGWGILNKLEGGKKNSPKLGIFIAESGIAEDRIFGWAALFIFLGAVFGFIAIRTIESAIVWVLIAFCFIIAALYRFITWYLNKDLKIEIYREGFLLRKDGQDQIVLWRDIDYVTEKWEKTVYQGIIHIYVHKIEVHRMNGTKLELNRSLQKIEEMGRYIQLAVTDALLPTCIERLKNNGSCDFGVFTINRSGIKYKDKVLAWQMIKSIDVFSMGRTTLKVQAMDGGKWRAWATENGGSVKNLNLFLNLSTWFINAAHLPVSNPNISEEPENGDVLYQLFLTKKEARNGIRKDLYVGTSLQERELTVKIPPNTRAGTTYRFPNYGRSNSANSNTGDLTIEILVETITPLQKRWEDTQGIFGVVILIGGLIWLGFWSSLDFVPSLIMAILIGGLGGALISIRQRWLGIISGALGGAISLILQIIYYLLMYIFFGQDSFWELEIVLVLFISALPGIGIYKLLHWWVRKKQEA